MNNAPSLKRYRTVGAHTINWLAAAALIPGLALLAAASASAFDRDQYNSCLLRGEYIDVCCIMADGSVIYDDEGYPKTCSWYSMDDPVAQSVPQPPTPAEPPPVLDPENTGPSNPLIPTLRGTDSGTIG